MRDLTAGLQSCCITDVGTKRKNNEDAVIYEPSSGFFGVADGMGGHNAGEVASLTAIKTFLELLNASSSRKNENDLADAVLAAHNEIVAMAFEDERYQGMGTTFTAVCLDAMTLYYAHVGDSRLYQIHENKITQITEDHSYVWELYKKGVVTKEECLKLPYKNIVTQALGQEGELRIDRGRVSMAHDTLVLICSDGLTDVLTDADILKIVSENSEKIYDACYALVEAAKDNGSKDNISVVAFWVEEKTEITIVS